MGHKMVNPECVFNSLQYGFSQAVIAEGHKHVFLSGQVAMDRTEQLVAGGMKEQARASLENIKNILAVSGGTMKDVTMLRIYIRHDANSHEEQMTITEALKAAFGTHAPASSWIIVYGLSVPEWLIEIEAHAVIAS